MAACYVTYEELKVAYLGSKQDFQLSSYSDNKLLNSDKSYSTRYIESEA